MKIFAIISILTLCPLFGKTQSFIGAVVGMDFANIEENKIYSLNRPFQYFEIYEEDYSAHSFSGGIRGEQQLAQGFSISLIVSYSHKKIKAGIGEIAVPIEGLKFSFVQSSVSLKWFPLSNWSIGAGPSLNYIPKVVLFYKDGHEDDFPLGNKKGYGIILSTSYEYKGFLTEIYFNKGLSFNGINEDQNDFKPIDSFGFSLGYLLRISKRKK